MSWLAGIAGKAEELLNKVDQAAATTLNTTIEEEESNYSRSNASSFEKTNAFISHSKSHSSGGQLTGVTASLGSSASVPSNLNHMNSTPDYLSQLSKPRLSTSNPSGKPLVSKSSTKDTDDELFKFLNSTGTNSQRSNGSSKTPPANKQQQHSRKSSTSSVGSKGRKTPDAGSVGDNNSSPGTPVMESKIDRGGTPDNITGDREGSDSPDHASLDIQEELMTRDSSSGYHSNPDDSNGSQQQLSSLELENRLLKNEVASLNQEMASVIQRAKSAQDELVQVKKQLQSQTTSHSQSDQVIRELRARENDLTEALNVKDTQLGVLRVRLEEADKEVNAKNKTIDSLTAEKDRVLQDHTTSSGVQYQALDSLKEKLSDAEEALRREQESSRLVQQESMQRQSKYEVEQHSLAESLSTAQKRLTDERTRITELNTQLKTAKTQADEARREMSDYKEKATRILQSKDKLIASLKEGTTGESSGEGRVSSAELEECRQERDMYREELNQSRMTIESLRTDIQDLEIQLQTECESLGDEIRSLEDQFSSEKQRREDAEQESGRQKQELRYAHEELVKQKTEYKNRVQERDAEIERLRNQLTTKSFSTTSQAELENRLHALTESLIQKQTMLEALSTEKNSLGLQLERLENQYKDMQATTVRANSTHVSIHGDDEEVRQRLPGFMKESPLDGDVARRVKRYANSIDRFSIRLGVFLRRYPIARVFVIVYMFLLHLWVMIVLLTYKPEMHESDYSPLPNGHKPVE